MPKGVYPRTRAHLRKLADARKKTGRDLGFRRKMSRVYKRRWRNPEIRRKMVYGIKKVWRDPKYRAKLLKAIRRLWQDPKYRAKQSKAMRRRWRDPKFAKKIIEGNLSLARAKPSKAQIKVFKELCASGIKGLKIDFLVSRFLLDIADPVAKRCAETDGPYWHRNRKKSDRRRDRILRSLGWKVMRVSVPVSHRDLEGLKLFFL